MTQEQVADALDMGRRHYGNVEKRLNKTNVVTAIKIARFFNCQVEDLWGDLADQ